VEQEAQVVRLRPSQLVFSRRLPVSDLYSMRNHQDTDSLGTWVLHPVALGMYAVMLACWFALPKVRKRTD